MQLSNILRKRLTSNDYQTRSKLSYLAIVRGNAKDYCGFYWDSACIRWDLEKHTGKRGWDDLQATYWRIAELYQRWQRLCRYRAEILPNGKTRVERSTGAITLSTKNRSTKTETRGWCRSLHHMATLAETTIKEQE